ncbi:MAG: hypothetical protein D6731_19235 [Planctomycetota bacterium]|nr:MAG: hypothetical protein D6731_19235 [Planctomycetota bacterium]
MIPRLRTFVVGLALLGLGTGCQLLQPKQKGDQGGGSSSAQGGGAAQAMVDSMKSTETQYLLALPPGAKVGVWWETTAGGAKSKYAVVGEQEGKLIVEQAMDVGGSTIINAWLVDPTIDPTGMPSEGEPMPANVVKAWIGVPGKPGEERPVMKPPVYKKTGGGSGGQAEQGDERVELAGKTWDAHWTQTAHGKTWMAKGSAFALKTTDASGKTLFELTGWGEDAKPQLAW